VGLAGFVVSVAVASIVLSGIPAGDSFSIVLPGNDKKTERPKVAIIIDDMGYDMSLAREFFCLDLPITLAIIPFSPYAASIAEKAVAYGYETLAHIPMEPKSFPEADPGPGALLLDMDAEGIEDAVARNLKRVPGARGASNHMGSAFTENPGKMEILLCQLKQRGLFFVDSATSPQTVGRNLARKLGVEFAARNVFLDNEANIEAIEKQLELLLLIAEQEGLAVGIGHPYQETLEVLHRHRERLLTRFYLVPISDVVTIPKNRETISQGHEPELMR
jgi:uncharacterized protein